MAAPIMADAQDLCVVVFAYGFLTRTRRTLRAPRPTRRWSNDPTPQSRVSRHGLTAPQASTVIRSASGRQCTRSGDFAFQLRFIKVRRIGSLNTAHPPRDSARSSFALPIAIPRSCRATTP
eukprot:scaffold65433_cov66-Phaeocystis_antarctica.AAC.16